MKILLSLLLVTTLSVNANQADVDRIEQAAMILNVEELTELANQYNGYAQALAYYRLAIGQNLRGLSEQANNSLDRAIKPLESLTAAQESHHEAWVLLAQVYGLKTAYQPIKAAHYAFKAEHAIRQGLALNNANPRAYLVKGIIEYHTPIVFGGSYSTALETLQRSIELFDQDVSSISWGHAEAFVWRGLTHMASNNKAQALTDWRSALVIAPNYGWPKMLLERNK